MSNGDGPHLPVEITSETEEVIKELVRLEDARLERDNRQADIQEKALDVSNEQDKRQAQFHGQRIQLQDEADQRRIRLVGRLLTWGAIGVGAPVALMLYMVFYGDESQSNNALEIIRTLGVAVAGYGIIHAVARAARSLLRGGRDS